MFIIKIIISILIVALFIYSKVSFYEDQISEKHKKAYGVIKSILKPILDFFKTVFKPYEIGDNLFIDTSQIILLILLIIILKA